METDLNSTSKEILQTALTMSGDEEEDDTQDVEQSVTIENFEIDTNSTTEGRKKSTKRKKTKRGKRRKRRIKGSKPPKKDIFSSLHCGPCAILVIWSALIVISWLCFILAEKICKKDVIYCLKNSQGDYIEAFLYTLIFSLCHFFILIHALFSRFRVLKYIGLLTASTSLLFKWYFNDSAVEKDWADRGNYFLIKMWFLFFVVVFGYLWLTDKLYGIKVSFTPRRLPFIVWIVVTGFFILRSLLGHSIWSCQNLNDSLDPRNRYSTKGGECAWEFGNTCWAYVIEGVFRPVYWGRETCSAKAYITRTERHRKM